jgi:sugar/nucleoside kinase (ribokinase family)
MIPMPSLLIVGGLTIDRFPDGSRAAGGSVLHAGLAAAAEGADLTFLTVANDEPEAIAGLERLGQLGSVRRQRSPSTTTYRHEESSGHRVLVYESAAEQIDVGALDGLGPFDVVLVAPIADELPPGSVIRIRQATRASLTVLLIQGWLRELRIGQPAVARRLDGLSPEAWAELGMADAIVVSTEDFDGEPPDPFAQAAALRSRLGSRPLLVLTLGEQGYILDDPTADRLVASVPRRVVQGVPMVGAGDTFGAALAIHLCRGKSPQVASVAATDAVIGLLDSRAP